MPKSLTRGPARLLVLAVALGGPLAVVDSASATGNYVPSAPGKPVATVASNGDVTVTWAPSELVDDPDSDFDDMVATESISGYTVSAFEAGSSVPVGDGLYESAVDTDDDGLSVVFDELPTDTYTFQVSAQESTDDDSTESAFSDEVEVYRFAKATDVTASATLERGQALVSWTAPSVPTGKPAIATYEVVLEQVLPDGDDSDPLYAEAYVDDPTADDVVVEGVRSGTYVAHVIAYDADGNYSRAESAEAVEVVGYDAPAAATEVTPVQLGEGRLGVSFQPGAARGYDVTGYEVKIQQRDGDHTDTRDLEGFDDTYAQFDDVPVGSYDVTVVTSYSGEDEDAEPVTSLAEQVDVVAVPGRVQGLVATKNADNTITLTWTAPAARQGVTVSGYVIGGSFRGADGAGADGYDYYPGGERTSFTTSVLDPGTYSYFVGAMVSDRLGGEASPANEITISAPTPTPTAPAKGAPVVQAKGGALESGEKATIAGTAPKGQVLQLQQREVTLAGARKTADGFTVLGKTKANKKGTYSFKQKFTRNVEVRVVNLTTGAVSPSSFVQVQKDLTLKAKKAGKRTLKLSGKVAPGGAGQVVKVLVKQGAGFVQVGQTTTNKLGAYSFKHTFASKGKAVVQVVSDASSANTAGSETRTFRVR